VYTHTVGVSVAYHQFVLMHIKLLLVAIASLKNAFHFGQTLVITTLVITSAVATSLVPSVRQNTPIT